MIQKKQFIHLKINIKICYMNIEYYFVRRSLCRVINECLHIAVMCVPNIKCWMQHEKKVNTLTRRRENAEIGIEKQGQRHVARTVFKRWWWLSATEVSPIPLLLYPAPAAWHVARRASRCQSAAGARGVRVALYWVSVFSLPFSPIVRIHYSCNRQWLRDVSSRSRDASRRHVPGVERSSSGRDNSEFRSTVSVPLSGRCVCFDMCVDCHIGLPHRCCCRRRQCCGTSRREMLLRCWKR